GRGPPCLIEKAVPSLDRMGQCGTDPVAVTLGRAGVDVAGEVGDLDQVVELVGNQGDERMAELVGGPVVAQTRAGAEQTEGPTEVRHRHRRAVAGAEGEALGVVEAEEALLLTVALEGGDEERVEADAAAA